MIHHDSQFISLSTRSNQTNPESLKCTPFILSEKYYYSLFVDFKYEAWHRGVNIPDREYYKFQYKYY